MAIRKGEVQLKQPTAGRVQTLTDVIKRISSLEEMTFVSSSNLGFNKIIQVAWINMKEWDNWLLLIKKKTVHELIILWMKASHWIPWQDPIFG